MSKSSFPSGTNVTGMTTDGRIVSGSVIDSSRLVLWVRDENGAIREIIRAGARKS